MKIKNCFVLRNIAGINTVVSADTSSEFDGMITLNDTGVFMWNALSEGCTRDELVLKVTAEYDIDSDTAARDIDAFIEKLKKIDVFE
jgi:hypothetical protein